MPLGERDYQYNKYANTRNLNNLPKTKKIVSNYVTNKWSQFLINTSSNYKDWQFIILTDWKIKITWYRCYYLPNNKQQMLGTKCIVSNTKKC